MTTPIASGGTVAETPWQPFVDAGLLAPMDVAAVQLLAPRFGESRPASLLGLMWASAASRMGHAGIDLATLRSETAVAMVEWRLERAARQAGVEAGVDDISSASGSTYEPSDPAGAPAAGETEAQRLVRVLPWPVDGARWHAETLASPMVGDNPDALRPFVRRRRRDGTTLLMPHRLACEEDRVAAALTARARCPLRPPEGWASVLDQLFGTERESEAATAVRKALHGALTVVTGGPGTGKTWSIRRLLAVLISCHGASAQAVRPLRIHLAAPTGKAAARMAEAIAEGGGHGLPEGVARALSTLRGRTLHRLIGLRPDGTSRHHAGQPLEADVVVVDECSMVDLMLMRRLLEAVPPQARLILLGDPDQLASVDAGRVLADIGEAESLAGVRAVFTQSRRFAEAPAVALAAACLQSGASAHPELPEELSAREQLASRLLRGEVEATGSNGEKRVAYQATDLLPRPDASLIAALLGPTLATYLPALEALPSDPDDAAIRALLETLDSHRVLTARRRGPFGSDRLEPLLAASLRRIMASRPIASPVAELSAPHWHGRPILITANAPETGLFNGDVGMILARPAGAVAVFAEGVSGVRRVPAARLPAHEGALAMTIHKSQGSQYRSVALLLAPGAPSLQTRELLYTGITRSQERLSVYAPRSVLSEALARRTQRQGTLQEAIDRASAS